MNSHHKPWKSGLCLVMVAFAVLTGCTSRRQNADTLLTASIPPIKYIVEYITCGDFQVNVLLPAGASPESYAPSASQIVDTEDSRLIFTSGLFDFEQELVSRISVRTGDVVNLSEHIVLKSGDCVRASEGHGHRHGVDPHIWTSPEQLKIMAANAYEAIKQAFPDSLKYRSAYRSLRQELDEASERIRQQTAASPNRSFIIYHPALTYYADDYGLEQIPLEREGKEPSAVYLENVIRRAKEEGITVVLYQEQSPATTVSTVASDIGAVPVPVNPLDENIVAEILRITDLITAR